MSAFKIKNMIASVAQILLAVILLPFVCIILHLILPESGTSLLLNIISECPFVKEILSVISGLLVQIQQGQSLSVSVFITSLSELIRVSIVEAVIIGMCIEMCQTLGIMLDIRGIPVLQTLTGIILGMIVMGNIHNQGYMIFVVAFLIIVNIVLILFMVSGQIMRKTLEIFLDLQYRVLPLVFFQGMWPCWHIFCLTVLRN